MKTNQTISLYCLILAVIVMVGTALAQEGGKQKFSASGAWLDACACSIPCGCEMAGVERGCEGGGALVLSAGSSYQGVNLEGVKIAYATVPGDWVRLYLDVPDASQKSAAEAFARAIYKDWGTIEAVTPAKIGLKGSGGRLTLTVAGGKIMKIETEPVLGGDKKGPIVHSNVGNPLVSTQFQGKTLSGSYHDGERAITLKDSNAFFSDQVQAEGEI